MKQVYLIIFSLLIVFSCSNEWEMSIQGKLKVPSQEYYINPNADTLLYGKEGTMIYIEKGSFFFYHGEEIPDSVTITLKELYKTSDIIRSNVTMRSGDKMLETGGMIELRAFSKGYDLTLKENKSIVLHFPRKSQTDSMRLFYGDAEYALDEGYNAGQGKVSWKLEENSVPKTKNKIVSWYTEYPNLDNSDLLLHNNRHVYDTLPDLFNFSKEEIQYFLNKTSKVHYKIDKKGKLNYENIDGSLISKKMENRLAKVAKKFPLCLPYTVDGEPIDMPGWFQIWSEITPPEYRSNKGYLNQIERQLSSDSTKSSLSIAELQYYIFDSKQLGWINCDQFIDPNPNKANFVVSVPESENIFVKIIFKNYKTVMIGNEEKGSFVFENLPINEPVKVVAIDEENGKPLLLIEDTKTSEKTFIIDKLNTVELKKLKEEIENLN